MSTKDGPGNTFLAANLTCHFGTVVFLVIVRSSRGLSFTFLVIPVHRHSVSPNLDSTKGAGYLLFLEN